MTFNIICISIITNFLYLPLTKPTLHSHLCSAWTHWLKRAAALHASITHCSPSCIMWQLTSSSALLAPPSFSHLPSAGGDPHLCLVSVVPHPVLWQNPSICISFIYTQASGTTNQKKVIEILYSQAPLHWENILHEMSTMLNHIFAFGDQFDMDLYCYYRPVLGDDWLQPKGLLSPPITRQVSAEASQQVQLVVIVVVSKN